MFETPDPASDRGVSQFEPLSGIAERFGSRDLEKEPELAPIGTADQWRILRWRRAMDTTTTGHAFTYTRDLCHPQLHYVVALSLFLVFLIIGVNIGLSRNAVDKGLNINDQLLPLITQNPASTALYACIHLLT
jgi:hypothetical protein